MIHSQTLKNAKPIFSKTLINTNQIVMQYLLDRICEEIKKADENEDSYIVIQLGERHFTKVTLQILALYGYKVEFYKDENLEATEIKWNKL